MEGWLGEMNNVFIYYFVDQAGDGDSPEFLSRSVCVLAFFGMGVAMPIFMSSGSFPLANTLLGPYMLQNLVSLNHQGWFT